MNKQLYLIIGALMLSFFSTQQIFGQSEEQLELEARKERLQDEISRINRLLSQKKNEKTTDLAYVDAFDRNSRMRTYLIKVTNNQTKLLNRQINNNINNKSKLRDDLKELKEDYAEMIIKTYRSKSQQSR